MKKVTILIITLIITFIINYILFVPSSVVNLMISVFINDSNTVILLSDLLISNFIFWVVFEILLTINNKKILKKD